MLASAWTEWVFTAKSFNPAYESDPSYSERTDRQAASANVKLALPYIRCSILDAMDAAKRIGLNKNTKYGPQPEIQSEYINLRKDCEEK